MHAGDTPSNPKLNQIPISTRHKVLGVVRQFTCTWFHGACRPADRVVGLRGAFFASEVATYAVCWTPSPGNLGLPVWSGLATMSPGRPWWANDFSAATSDVETTLPLAGHDDY